MITEGNALAILKQDVERLEDELKKEAEIYSKRNAGLSAIQDICNEGIFGLGKLSRIKQLIHEMRCGK